MRWGPDHEERASVAKKAHDAYATASAAREAIAGVMAHAEELAGEMGEIRPLIDHMRRTITQLSLRIDELERAARPVPKARKAA